MTKLARLWIVLALLLSAAGMAHVRLINPGTGDSLFWSNPSNVSIVIQDMGSDNIADGSAETALKGAIEEWNSVIGSAATLVENESPSQKARTDWTSSSIHLMMFDENNSSGYFPTGSGTVALTPLWFYGNGTLSDADILFNGKNFNFTTSGSPGAFDVQDVATHELGHLLGLDHSGVAGATMYPYVDSTVILHRSLSSDDEGGMRDVYPSAAVASISGRVRRSSGAGVAGAYVVARDATGRLAGSALANSGGYFGIRGLQAGTFTLFARPLDKPVSNGNLTAGHAVETTFEATYLAGTVILASGQAKAVSDLVVGADVSLSLGRTSDNFPLRVVRGQTKNLLLHGSGLAIGSSLISGDSSFGVSANTWFGSQLSFSVTVPANAPPGLVDLEVVNSSGHRSILPGALEVTPPDPVVTSSSPPVGPIAGGVSLIIKGTDFRSGARVVIGNRIYRDGELGGCSVLDDTTIMLTTAGTLAGSHDVVVIDETGVEGRLNAGHMASVVPVLDTVFPLAGNRMGGTEMVLRGNNFVAGAVVRIDGVTQSNVALDGSTRLVVTTNGGVEGGPYQLEVENPGGGVATNVFSYVRPEDPNAVSMSPDLGPASGGETVTLLGSNFTGSTQVFFGADGDTGLGGVEATNVTLVNTNTLLIEVPPNSGGTKNVMVRRADTAQASVLLAAYTYEGGDSGGASCGAQLGRKFSGGDMLGGSFWFLVVFGVSLLRRRRALV